MKHREATTSLYLYPASASPLVLVIRRGPSKWWHFLTWNRETGEVQPGSWFNGMLYPQRCDFSTKGDAMVLLAFKGGKKSHAWTALCTPPWATADIFWPHDGANFGGGYFDDRLSMLWLNLNSHHSTPEVRLDKEEIEIGYLDKHQPFFGCANERLKRSGWQPRDGQKIKKDNPIADWIKDSPDKKLRLHIHLTLQENPSPKDHPLFSGDQIYSLSKVDSSELPRHLEGVTWADWNSRSELCFAQDGRLIVSPPEDAQSEKRLVVDLNGLEPRKPLRSQKASPRSGVFL